MAAAVLFGAFSFYWAGWDAAPLSGAVALAGAELVLRAGQTAGAADPDRPVVALIGDGGLAMSGLELLAAVRAGLEVRVGGNLGEPALELLEGRSEGDGVHRRQDTVPQMTFQIIVRRPGHHAAPGPVTTSIWRATRA